MYLLLTGFLHHLHSINPTPFGIASCVLKSLAVLSIKKMGEILFISCCFLLLGETKLQFFVAFENIVWHQRKIFNFSASFGGPSSTELESSELLSPQHQNEVDHCTPPFTAALNEWEPLGNRHCNMVCYNTLSLQSMCAVMVDSILSMCTTGLITPLVRDIAVFPLGL